MMRIMCKLSQKSEKTTFIIRLFVLYAVTLR